jgi:hypothetical protein
MSDAAGHELAVTVRPECRRHGGDKGAGKRVEAVAQDGDPISCQGSLRTDGQQSQPVLRGVDGDERAGVQMWLGDIDGGQEGRAEIGGKDCLGSELDHRGGESVASQQNAEVEILSQDHRPVLGGVGEELVVWCIAGPDGGPVLGVVAYPSPG